MRLAPCVFFAALLTACGGAVQTDQSEPMLPATTSSEAELASNGLTPAFPTNSHPVCSKLGTQIGGTQTLLNWCKGPIGGPTTFTGPRTFGNNVDAANPLEDIAKGQSNPSVATVPPYVVEAWNDGTGFFVSCPSSTFKDEFSSFGFSNNGGTSFVDMGGFANTICTRRFWDPSVAAWTKSGVPYFYVGSLLLANGGVGHNGVGIEPCRVVSGQLSCSTPIIPFLTACNTSTPIVCDVPDKETLTIDPLRGRLYMTFNLFNRVSGQSTIRVLGCSLTNPLAPSCSGAVQVPTPSDTCENEGAYPAIDPATGDLYVAWEHNWWTNVFSSTCASKPVSEIVDRFSPTLQFLNGTTFTIRSLDTFALPGYSGQRLNDYPEIAVSDASSAVTIVWNDTRFHPFGDILMQSFNFGLTLPKTTLPIRINTQTTGPHFMPAVTIDSDGDCSLSWYQRANATTSLTDVFAAIDVNPNTFSPPVTNIKLTSGSSNWSSGTSNLQDRWGDYADAFDSANTLYVVWSDGRLGAPQPFEVHLPTQ